MFQKTVVVTRSNLTRLYCNGSAAKSHSATTQYRQLRRLRRLSTVLRALLVQEINKSISLAYVQNSTTADTTIRCLGMRITSYTRYVPR